MALTAFVSDIHGNAEALRRVYDDIDNHPVSRVVCLGDIVGYGPDPEVCTDYVMERSVVALMGNHDYALLNGPANFNPIAAEVIDITRQRMDPRLKPKSTIFDTGFPLIGGGSRKGKTKLPCRAHDRLERWSFIERLEKSRIEGRLLYVHASPLDPISEYVFPDRFGRWWNKDRIAQMFEMIDWLAFCGHTHMPCVIDDMLQCTYPENVENRFTLHRGRKYIVNVGSVGQPRDGDPRACYLLFDEEKGEIIWRRVEYDLEVVVRGIERMIGKGHWAGVRLRLGK